MSCSTQVDSKAASRLLSSQMDDCMESFDSDDCESDTECHETLGPGRVLGAEPIKKSIQTIAAERLKTDDEKKEGNGVDYHKMTEVEDRTFQTDLLEMAKKVNLIICLPTGSGKTFIALKLTEHILPEAIEFGKKVIFCANNVPLVIQQAKYFSSNLSNTVLSDDKYVRHITGDLNVDVWKDDQWNLILNSHHILVLSTQIILDAINKAYVKWSQIALLILDECHHAQKSHPMAQLMKSYAEHRGTIGIDKPKVLGLTATIIKGKSKVDKIPDEIKELEQLLCCKAVTHKNYEEILQCSTQTLLVPLAYSLEFTVDDPMCQDLVNCMTFLGTLPTHLIDDDRIASIECIDHPSLISEDQIFKKKAALPKTLKSFLADLLKTYVELGPYCGKIAAIIKQIYIYQWLLELEASDDEEENCDKEIPCVEGPLDVVELLQYVFTALVSFARRLDIFMNKSSPKGNSTINDVTRHQIKHCVSQKVKLLWDILLTRRPKRRNEEENDTEDEICGVVFCTRRITAQVLRWYLVQATKFWPEELEFIRPEVMVGHSTIIQDTEAARFTANHQSAVIRRFHAKELNLLIATQVVEEGLNVPACNIVVRFDTVDSYPSFVQSLGRARKQGAKCYALIDKSIEGKETKKIGDYVDFNNQLAAALQENALHVGEDDSDSSANLTDTISPFCPSGQPDGPKVTAVEAISLVHRYCSLLSCDKIAILTAISWWKKEEKSSGGSLAGFKAFVQLPILAPINEVIEGPIMPDKMHAKRAVFLETCKRLYEAGELTENLLPKPRSIENFRCEFLDKLNKEFKEEKETTLFKIGSRNRTQWYRKMIPDTVSCSFIMPELSVFLYKLEIKLSDYPTGNLKAKQLYEFNRYSHAYGLLTTADITKIPNFKLNASYGTFTVGFKKISLGSSSNLTLTHSQIALIQSFQCFLCDCVYGINNPAIRVDTQCRTLVTPLKKDSENYEINWELINDVLELDENSLLLEPSEEKRLSFAVSGCRYDDAVVVPWYKKTDDGKPEMLCVLKVQPDLLVSSKCKFLPDSNPDTYKDYFEKKYKVKLFQPETPLLVCKSIGKQSNFLTMKLDSKVVRQEVSRSIMDMVPELVNIHPLPASLFVQGRYLPSILQRVHGLLLAEELRRSVGSYFDWDVEAEKTSELTMIELSQSICDSSDDENNETELKSGGADTQIEADETSKKKKSIVCLDMINPFEISWDKLHETKISDSSPLTGKQMLDSKFAMPEPPTLKSGVELMDIDKIDFPSFDKITDFSVEKGPSCEEILEALTLSNAQDCISLERQEVMGDSVLKLIVSLHVFRSFPTWDEGKMTLLRTKLISNLHFYQLGKLKKLGELLSASFFLPDKNWIPSAFCVPEDVAEFMASTEWDYNILKQLMISGTDELNVAIIKSRVNQFNVAKHKTHTNYTHSRIGDKSIADAMESLIGAYFLNGGLDSALRVVEWLGLRGPLMDGSTTVYSRQTMLSYFPIQDCPSPRKQKQNVIPFLKDLEDILQYKFKNQWLAVEALTHPTYNGKRSTDCYERLEFVGDAILDFLVTDYILKKTNITNPGKITDLRSALVNNVTFGSLAVRYGFQSFLKQSSKPLSDKIHQFVAFQIENNHEIENPFKLYTDFDCPTVREIEVPKVLGDIFESIAGAVFVDSGMSIDTVWKIFYRLMKKEIEKFSKRTPKSPIRELYERFPNQVKFGKTSENNNPKNSKGNFATKYKVVSLKVPKFDKYIIGVGTTIKQAQQAAAKYAVRRLNEETIPKAHNVVF